MLMVCGNDCVCGGVDVGSFPFLDVDVAVCVCVSSVSVGGRVACSGNTTTHRHTHDHTPTHTRHTRSDNIKRREGPNSYTTPNTITTTHQQQ